MLSNYHILFWQFFATRFPKKLNSLCTILQIFATSEFVRYDTALWDLKFKTSKLPAIWTASITIGYVVRSYTETFISLLSFHWRHLERCGQRELESLSLSLAAGDTRNIQLVCPNWAGVVLRTWRSFGNVVSALDYYWLSTNYLKILPLTYLMTVCELRDVARWSSG